VYNKAELKPDAASKARIFSLLRLFAPGEPTRKKVIIESVGWSARYGEYPAGDPELHHVVGCIYAEGASFAVSPWTVDGICTDAYAYAQRTNPLKRNGTSYSARKIHPPS
jgi:hypothetical protein